MLVLREDLQERIARQVRTDVLKWQTCRRLAFDPQIDRRNLVALLDHGICKIELAVKFECPCLNRQSPRGGAGPCRLVDDTHLDPELGQPERQDEARRTGTDD